MPLSKEVKTEVIQEYQRDEKDTGSPEVQVALLTKRINQLTDHLRTHKHDESSRRGLLKLVGRRRKLLAYIHRKDYQSYIDITNRLKIPRVIFEIPMIPAITRVSTGQIKLTKSWVDGQTVIYPFLQYALSPPVGIWMLEITPLNKPIWDQYFHFGCTEILFRARTLLRSMSKVVASLQFLTRWENLRRFTNETRSKTL